MQYILVIAILCSIVLSTYGQSHNYSCRIIGDEDRLDCHPALGATQDTCLNRGCCWNSPTSGVSGNVPYCFYPTNYPGYILKSSELIKGGYRYYLEREVRTYIPGEIMLLMADLTYVSESILRLRITDRLDSRFQVPYVFNVTPIDEPINNNFRLEVNRNPFSLKAWNRLTNEKILDTSVGPLLYADQYIEISSSLPNKYVYGLGEHRNPLKIDCSWQTIPFWNRDQPPVINHNLYGSQPMLIAPGSTDKFSYGLFMLNSNAMEVVLQPTPTITFRTIGGVIDLFIYAGPSAKEVVRQHWTVVQFPHFQPYWAMGMHLCRYGYTNITHLRTVINRMKEVGFQYDVQWTDIDAMRDRLVFTYDNINWPGLPDLVKELHDSDMRYTPINDPCIGIAEPGTYPALDAGLQLDVFIRDKNGELLVGRVWPGDCYFPDFTSPNAVEWWSEQIRIFNHTAPFDGFWIDMNEPANFVHGSVTGCFDDDKLDNPWYVPKIITGKLWDKTVCPSAKQVMSTQYNLHSLYALIETKVTLEAIDRITPTKRHFILSRATFAGSGHYAGHWSGDNWSTWNDLYYSIPEMLAFQFYGMPFVGADICGFFENTNEELCMRWMQIGAFYPFMRNHNTINVVDQDPAVFGETARYVMHQALLTRYRLMPYWYTLNYRAYQRGDVILNPMYFICPEDVVCQRLDTQFLLGEALLVAPVLTQGATDMIFYLPNEQGDPFYDYYTGGELNTYGWNEMNVNTDTFLLLWRPGFVVPMHQIDESKNAIQNRNSPFNLLVTLSKNKVSKGELYWDDGDTKEAPYTLISFTANDGFVHINRITSGYVGQMMLAEVKILGLDQNSVISSLRINSVSYSNYQKIRNMLTINSINRDMNTDTPITITWGYSSN